MSVLDTILLLAVIAYVNRRHAYYPPLRDDSCR